MKKFNCYAMSLILLLIRICDISSDAASNELLLLNNKNNDFSNIKNDWILHKFFVDLDSNGEKETVILKLVYKENEVRAGFVNFLVVNKAVQTIYQAPEPFLSFGPTGVDELVMVHDFNRNGQLEFLVERGRSDVGLSSFDLYEWHNNKLEKIRQKISFVLNETNKVFDLVDSKSYYNSENITFLNFFQDSKNQQSEKNKIRVGSYSLKGLGKQCEIEIMPIKKGFKILSDFTNCKTY
jgi:hypothetical protein